MLPLLRRDGQALAALVCTAAWNWLIGYVPWAALATTRRTWVAWLSAVRGRLTQAMHAAIAALLVLDIELRQLLDAVDADMTDTWLGVARNCCCCCCCCC